MDVLEFISRLGLSAGVLRMPTKAMDQYFADLFDEDLRSDPARYAFAATTHAATHKLNHKSLASRLAGVGFAGSDAKALENAFRRTHPDLHLRIAREPAASVKALAAGLPRGRRLGAVFSEAPLPDIVSQQQGGEMIVVNLLPPGRRLPLPAAQYQDFAGFTLAVDAR